VRFQVVPRRVSRVFAVALVFTLAAWIGGISPALAAGGPKPAPVDGSGDNATPVWTPLGLRPAQTIVVVQLTGNPVTVTDSTAPSRLSNSQKEQLQ
jgi:hypothetical protein